MEKLEATIGTIKLETPLIAVSGIFSLDYYNLLTQTNQKTGIGAVVSKSITKNMRMGNPEPRIIETPHGLLNSIGLQNPGINKFIEEEIPKYRCLEVPFIVSIAGENIDEYVYCAKLLNAQDMVDGIELNVSCPNIEKGGIEFGCNIDILSRLVSKVRKVFKKTLIVKLTPNVDDIAKQARTVINCGVDAISLINTVRGMVIDLLTYRPKLGNKIGGLSGSAIHPVAVYMVYHCYRECCKKNKIPIIGIGGVTNADEAFELILAGATCVGIGTAFFRKHDICKSVAEGLMKIIDDRKGKPISSFIGKATE